MDIFYEILQSIILGVIQGLTEFLPISSSGHIEIAKVLFKEFSDNPIEANTFFSILLHGATLVAVCIAFRKRIGDIIHSLFRFITRKTKEEDKINLQLFLMLCAATAVTALAGFAIKQIDDSIIYNSKFIGSCFFITGIILIVSHFFKGERDYRQFGFIRAIFVGFAQGIGILPGISRSGITISTALTTGMSREKAGEFSFLLSIPAILGASILEMKDATQLFQNVDIIAVLLGMTAAFFTGLLSLYFLLSIIKKGRLFVFSFYLIPVGILTLIFI